MAVFTFDMEANREKIQAFRSFIDDNRLRKGVLMPVLQDAQSRFGYLPKEVLETVKVLNMEGAEAGTIELDKSGGYY